MESAQQIPPWKSASLRSRLPAMRTAKNAPRKDEAIKAMIPKMPEPAPSPFAGCAE